MKEGGFQQGEGGQAKRTSLEVGESMTWSLDPKLLQEGLKSLGFTPSPAKPELEKEVGR